MKPGKVGKQQKQGIVLEAEASLEGSDPHKSLIFLYGDPKVGKSEFFSNFPDVYFIATEKGLGRLNVRKSYVEDWEDFLKLIKHMKKAAKSGEFHAGYIVVDTADLLFHLCVEYVCNKMNIDSIADAKWGKGWSALGKEWINAINILCNIGPSIGFIGHASEKEVVVKGITTAKTIPEMQKKGFKTLNALCDYIIYARLERVGKGKSSTEERFMYLRGTPEIEAGSRDGNSPLKLNFSYDSFLGYCDGSDEQNKPSAKKKKKKGVKKKK